VADSFILGICGFYVLFRQKISQLQRFHSREGKIPKICVIGIPEQAKSVRFCWESLPEATIFNPIEKLTITRTGANLNMANPWIMGRQGGQTFLLPENARSA